MARRYVGLTDDPVRRRQEHGNPSDWQLTSFLSEWQARHWEQSMIRAGCVGGPGGAGWRYGYCYTITPFTRQ